MKEDDLKRSGFLILGLLSVFILSACTPPTPASLPAEVTSVPEPVVPDVMPSEVSEAAPVELAETEPPSEEVLAVATSRGNGLVATDPTTINLSSGQPQLIEFFAFW